MNSLTQPPGYIDMVFNHCDLRKVILSHIPPKNSSWPYNSGLKNSACVSTAWNKDAKIIKQQWVEKYFVPLRTYGGFNIVGSLIEYIAKNKIKHVNLYEYRPLGFSDPYFVGVLFEKCEGLQSLSLECNSITDRGLTSISKECPSLQMLNLERNEISDVGLTNIIQKCPNLLSLFLGNTHYVTGAGLPSILKNCPNLQVLSLENIHITDDELANILEKCVKLQSLSVSWTKITDAGLASIFKNCHDLTSLDLTYVKQITDDGFASIQENSPLQSLRLSETNITDVGIASILEKCPGLRTLDLLYKPENITARGLANIKEKYPNLQLILEHNLINRINEMIGQTSSIEVSVEFDAGFGNSLVLCGNGEGLSWDPSKGRSLKCTGKNQWTISIHSDVKQFKLVLKTKNGAFKWEKLDANGNHSLDGVQFPLKPKF